MNSYTCRGKTPADPYWSATVDVATDEVAIDGITLRTRPAPEGSEDLYAMELLTPNGVRLSPVAEQEVIDDLLSALEQGAQIGETWSCGSRRHSLPGRVSGPGPEDQAPMATLAGAYRWGP